VHLPSTAINKEENKETEEDLTMAIPIKTMDRWQERMHQCTRTQALKIGIETKSENKRK
jgi:hypothetical protein